MRYTIITPTILRDSLIRCCESVDRQTSTDWQHLVMVDTEISNDVLPRIHHPQRTIIRCERPHDNWGHTCRNRAWTLAKGDYLYYLDDDNYLADERVLKDLDHVISPWALLPILRHGKRFFHNPPGKREADTGSILVRRDLGPWPDSPDYDADGQYIESLVKQHP